MPETGDSTTAGAGDAMADSETGPKPPSERRRPRKKLSFREPEIVGCEKYRQMKERSATESIIKSARGEAEGAAEPRPPQEGTVQERHRGGSLDSQLSVRLVLRPGAAGVTSIETESPPTPARRLADSTSPGSMDDLDLQVSDTVTQVRATGQ